MGDFNFVVGQQFADVKTFRKAIKEAAIAQRCELKVVKSDLVRYFAKCAKEGCPWHIHAVKIPNIPTFTIRSIEGTHTCDKDTQLGHQQASVDWIVNLIEERLKENVNYKPKDILQDIQTQYGITIPYKQAWRAKERGLASIYGSSEEGYCLLPAFCKQLMLSNPNSVAKVFTSGSDHHFHRLFVSLGASVYGFLNGCVPVVGLGGIELRSKYLGTLLSATSYDADSRMFPIAFGIVDMETDDSWMWFLTEFHKVLDMNSETIPQLRILSDGKKPISEAVKRKFPSAYQGICLRHLTESINKEFKNSRLVQLISKAAYSVTSTGFRERMMEIEEVCPEAAKRIQQVPPCLWSSIHFGGLRFGHLSSNIEEFNKWILEARELPIIQVVEQIHCKLMKEFDERRHRATSWTSTLVPSAEKRISEAICASIDYQVLRSDEVEFEVLSFDCSHIVNIGTRSCSCREWKLYGIPCSHAIAALISNGKNVHDYTEKFFTVAKYLEVYSQRIQPIPDRSEWIRSNEALTDDGTQMVRPPKFRRPPGRPEKKRLCMEEHNREKHTVHCSRCNQTGHYKRTCKADINERI